MTERERLSLLVEELADREGPGRTKMMLIIAARAVRRGRLLTPAEQLGNLKRFLDAPQDEPPMLRRPPKIAKGTKR